MSSPLELMLVADGPRDDAMLPPLIAALLKVDTNLVASRHWSKIRLRSGGYDRKLRFVMREAIAEKVRALVATVDTDESPKRSRLADLQAGRDAERTDAKSPAARLAVAIGEADPHAEAWLLDDPVAVRSALRLDGDASIPNVRKVAPKDALDALCGEVDDRLPLLAAIAAGVDPARCPHLKETGLQRFIEELRRELGALLGE